MVFLLTIAAFVRWPIASSVHADSCVNSGGGSESCTNEGNADAEVDQDGSAGSGDANGGQTVGVVSDGDTRVDATNRSDDVDVSTGDASGSNSAEVEAFAGVRSGSGGGIDRLAILINIIGLPSSATRDDVLDELRTQLGLPPDATEQEIFDEIEAVGILSDEELAFMNAFLLGDESGFCSGSGGSVCVNRGDADASTSQSADVGSGDGVAGQIIGLLTRRGRAEAVLSNATLDSTVETGDGEVDNRSATSSSAGVVADSGFVSSPK